MTPVPPSRPPSWQEQALTGELAVAARIVELEDELLELRSEVGHWGRLRFRGGGAWCERRSAGGQWEGRYVEHPVLDEWDHVCPVLWIDDPEWINSNGGKAGGMSSPIESSAVQHRAREIRVGLDDAIEAMFQAWREWVAAGGPLSSAEKLVEFSNRVVDVASWHPRWVAGRSVITPVEGQ